MSDDRIFATWAPQLREVGLEPRPVTPGTKACKLKDWQRPDSFFDSVTFADWERAYASHGVGLRMGTALSDGTYLGALDIDDDRYTNIGHALLHTPLSGRVGRKGAVFFFRYQTLPEKRKFRVLFPGESEPKLVAELLVEGALCVLPPTIHPDTGGSYTWLGRPLHEVDLRALPLIGGEQ